VDPKTSNGPSLLSDPWLLDTREVNFCHFALKEDSGKPRYQITYSLASGSKLAGSNLTILKRAKSNIAQHRTCELFPLMRTEVGHFRLIKALVTSAGLLNTVNCRQRALLLHTRAMRHAYLQAATTGICTALGCGTSADFHKWNENSLRHQSQSPSLTPICNFISSIAHQLPIPQYVLRASFAFHSFRTQSHGVR
jgi:hypothetical protein